MIERTITSMKIFTIWFLALGAFAFRWPALVKSNTTDLETPKDSEGNTEISLNYRLPNETYPEHYDITLTTNVHTGEKSYKGEVTIYLVVVKPTAKIVVHARQLKEFNVNIASLSAEEWEELEPEYDEERDFLILNRKRDIPFAADTKWKLSLTYSSELREDKVGFYMSTYKDAKGNDHYLATTQFESINARYAFPCYDEPAKRANFTITINHSPAYSAISNMPVNKELSSSGKTVFLTTARIPTYIVSFIVSDFQYSEVIVNGLPQRLYSRPGRQQEHEWALVSGMLVLKRLSEYLNLPFMLPKMDHVAVPDFTQGGMENWGLATYREEYLLYNTNTSTVFAQTEIASLSAHEISHQWLGDYVTVKWWSYLWIKEGFATLLSYKALDDIYPEWYIWQQFHVSIYQLALSKDASNSSKAMTAYVQKPEEIAAIYDSISYNKAASVLHMWNNALTEEVFKQGLHNFLTLNKYSAVEEKELFTAIETSMKEKNYNISANFSLMMASWTQQANYPLLTVIRNYKEGSFNIIQEAFYDDKNFKNNKTWYIPLNYAVASNPDFRNTEATHYLLNVTGIEINDTKIDNNDWLILNKRSTGYYRINYDNENWNLIIAALCQNYYKIHPFNRAQLMHDAYYLSVSNRLNHDILLKMLTYLKKEYHYAPWYTANDIINNFNIYLSSDANYNDLKFFLAEMVGPIYDKLGINDVPGDPHYQKYTRNVIIDIACLAGIEDCLEGTKNKLKALVKYNMTIEPNVQVPIYCNALKQSNDEEFNFVYNKLMDSSDLVLRALFISSLGCSQNKNHIKKLIESSIDETNKLSQEERYTLLNAVYSRGEIGLLACIEFLNENWQVYSNLKSSGGSNPLVDDIRDMSAYVINKEQEEQLLALVATVKININITATLEKDVNTIIKANYDWLENNRKPLMSWFAEYRSINSAGSAGHAVSGVMMISIVMMFVLNN
ncbi:aminopeptidase N-like [Calliphora vicina]|uniref:aminopeptidase N-like n=1 Tax=Calliphora vicina TaxID=7373 RepID=UPI00325B0D7E